MRVARKKTGQGILHDCNELKVRVDNSLGLSNQKERRREENSTSLYPEEDTVTRIICFPFRKQRRND